MWRVMRRGKRAATIVARAIPAGSTGRGRGRRLVLGAGTSPTLPGPPRERNGCAPEIAARVTRGRNSGKPYPGVSVGFSLPKPAPGGGIIAGMGRSILVVDDDPAFRDLAERILAGAGIEVTGQADSAEAAITTAQETMPDAVLVDIDLPDRDGIALAALLTALPWRPRVVLTSVDPDAAGTEEVRRSGAIAFLSKDKLTNGTLLRLLHLD
jgi:CheY-like chemotaxis protein